MADRNTPASATFEEWRVEFNELATDVGDISNLPSTINGQNVTDVIEAITQVNAGLSNVLFPNVIDFDDSPNANNERIKMGNSDDLQLYGNLQMKNNGQTFSFPATGGNLSTEGFSIAVAVALG